MDQNTLKTYLKNVYELEASVYNQKKLVDSLSSNIYRLQQTRERSLLQKETLDDYLDMEVAWTIIRSSIGSAPILYVFFSIVKSEIVNWKVMKVRIIYLRQKYGWTK